MALAAAMMIVGALDQGSPLGRALSARPLVLLGRLSYSLYLWHFGVFQVVAAHTARWPAPARVLLAWALTTAIAAFSYRYVEGPALALKNRLGGRRWHYAAPADAPPAPAPPPAVAAAPIVSAAHPGGSEPEPPGS